MRNSRKTGFVLYSAIAFSTGMAASAFAADSTNKRDEFTSDNQIIVTARRIEERLQDVPISITVINPQKLAKENITSPRDLATYTPGMTTVNRSGNNSTSFTIRGFTQERFTTSTVGTYFADVVAPRGSGGTVGGDGAGPGALFDLQNVQVLKGPQGTLFGRNSTGGAVLLVPQKPTDKWGGYIEGSGGDYNMYRVQGVVNMPLSNTFKLRLGLDHNKRDGYQKNIGNLGNGPYGKDMGSLDYWAFRASAVLDVTQDIENYTIGSFNISKSAGNTPRLFACTANKGTAAAPVGIIIDPVTRRAADGNTYPDFTLAGLDLTDSACKQMVREAATPWTVENPVPNSQSKLSSWQIINTTTWTASDNLTVKNILSYAEFRQTENGDFFGTYYPIGGITAAQVTGPQQITSFVTSISDSATGHNNAQSTMVEELQFQGRAHDNRLVWQAGLYYENSRPLGPNGSQSNQIFTPCADIANFVCTPFTVGQSFGSGNWSRFKNSFRDMAAYAQASYDLTDQLKFTAGIRYTDDKVVNKIQLESLSFRPNGVFTKCTNAAAPGFNAAAAFPGYTIDQRYNICSQSIENSTKAPTWLLDLDYKPFNDLLLYAKWSRGYRQGGVAGGAPDTLQKYGAEKVDTYEVGAKTAWRGSLPGSFNVSGFYNDFRNQQLQLGVECFVDATHNCVGTSLTTTVANVGKSRLYGFESELSVSPFQGLKLDAAYAYLNTKILAATAFVLPATSIYNHARPVIVGDPIPNALPHKVTLGATYLLPLPESYGDLSVGGS
ncbi:MAG: TonB-dependent receptor, partial [Rhodospirillaceae bacterium]